MSFMVSPYRFAASGLAPSALYADAFDFETGTTVATVNYTDNAKLGGSTPSAVILAGSYSLVASGASETAAGTILFGFILPGDDSAVLEMHQRTAVNPHITQRILGDRITTTNIPFIIQEGTTLRCRATSTGIVADGFSLTYNAASTNIRCAAMPIWGTGINASGTVVNLGTGTAALDQVAPGFMPDAVICFSHVDSATGGNGNNGVYTIGFATSDGTQRCVAYADINNVATVVPYQAIFTDTAMAALSTAGALSWKAPLSAFDSSGFSITPSANAGSSKIAYLALKGGNFKIVDVSTPTSTGSQAITGAGFTPRAAILILTDLETVQPTSFPLTSSALMGAISVTFLGTETWSSACRNRAGAAPSQTASNCQAKVLQPSGTNTAAGQATLTAFTSDGMTLNWSAVQANAKKGFVLFIG